ncbi:hypothetical protein DLM78_09560 [Leptospira stimsonii]|uniref:Uncharacterized protein n=1 Tax=Leptospira stimsonii TaxID=2202203 RepID=A0A8B3CQR3_9LEPT|nr:hypothetical protein DLM78_09560 [Leptospira stimsonii]
MANLRQFSLRFQEFKTFRKISRLEFKETHAPRNNRKNRRNSVCPNLFEKFDNQKRSTKLGFFTESVRAKIERSKRDWKTMFSING